MLSATTRKPGFMLYLGDLPEHDPTANLHDDMRTVLEDLRTLATRAGIPVLYLPGNNDSLDGDYCPFASNDAPPFETPLSLDPSQGWPLAGGKGSCTSNSGPCIKDQEPRWGYYSAYPVAGSNLRVIALNTAVVSTNTMCDSIWSGRGIDRAKVAADQLDWLEGQMKEAACVGATPTCTKDRVLVAMHVAPGIDGYGGDAAWRPLTDNGKYPATRDRFLDIMSRYEAVTMGTLTAHSHMEEIRRLHEGCDSSFFGVALSLPGITPPHGNNPAFKIFHYDGNKVLTDFEVHYRPLDDCSSWGAWGTYSFKNLQIVPAASGGWARCSKTSIAECVAEMQTSGLDRYEVLDRYYSVLSDRGSLNYQTMYDVEPTSCGN